MFLAGNVQMTTQTTQHQATLPVSVDVSIVQQTQPAPVPTPVLTEQQSALNNMVDKNAANTGTIKEGGWRTII